MERWSREAAEPGNADCRFLGWGRGESDEAGDVMLDAYVIEEIKRRDRERQRDDRPAIELPVPPPPDDQREPDGNDPPDKDRDRGVVIIDYGS